MMRLIRGATVVTCNDRDEVVEADVLVDGSLIAAIGPNLAPAEPHDVIPADGHALLPGFVQGHVHLVQTLFRGLADDLPLLPWLRTRIWPLEASHDDESLSASAELAMVEMLKGGTTCFNDMGTTFGHEVVLAAIDRLGMRAVSGKCLMDVASEGVPRGLVETQAHALRAIEAHAAAYRGHPRLRVSVCPRFILSCSEGLMRGAVEVAQELGLFVHTHVAEHADEREAVVRLLGAPDLAVLTRWGVTGPQTILAHGVQLSDDELRNVAREGSALVHCPSANLKLGSGVARLGDWLSAGVRTALGADGAPCNNNLDALTEVRLAALLSCMRAGPGRVPAARVLRLATLDSARALGLGATCGSIEVGKSADLVLLNLGGAHLAPVGSPSEVAGSIVYAARSTDVRWVMIDGEVRVRDGQLCSLDESRVVANARQARRHLLSRANTLPT